MSNSFPQTIGGKLLVNSPLSASSDRYTFLSLPNAEPNLGAPRGLSGTCYFNVTEPVSGTRVWSSSASITQFGNNIGIGLDLPREKLTVVGNISATGTIYGTLNGANSAAAGNDTYVQYNSGGRFGADSAFTWNRTYSGLIIGGFTNQLSANNGQIIGAGGNYVQAAHTNSIILGTNITTNAANYTFVNNLSTPGSIVGNNIFATNAIGVGTLTPNQQLTVVGNISATGNLYGTLQLPQTALLAAGFDTYVQYNSSGNLAGNSTFTYNYNLTGLKVGITHILTGTRSSILGGQSNCVSSNFGIVGGGNNNNVSSDYASILGGRCNSSQGTHAVVGGGNCNSVIASGYASSIVGGELNTVTSDYGAVLGGRSNTLSHNDAFILGSNLASNAVCTTFVNNLSTPGTLYGNLMQASSATVTGNLSAKGNIQGNIVANTLTLNSASFFPTLTATNSYITITVGTSSLALPLYRYT
jgi:hypothetical protein